MREGGGRLASPSEEDGSGDGRLCPEEGKGEAWDGTEEALLTNQKAELLPCHI